MNNYIYKIKDQEFVPKYYIDVYSQNPPDEFWEREYEYAGEARKLANENGYCYGTPLYAESDVQIVMFFQYVA